MQKYFKPLKSITAVVISYPETSTKGNSLLLGLNTLLETTVTTTYSSVNKNICDNSADLLSPLSWYS